MNILFPIQNIIIIANALSNNPMKLETNLSELYASRQERVLWNRFTQITLIWRRLMISN